MVVDRSYVLRGHGTPKLSQDFHITCEQIINVGEELAEQKSRTLVTYCKNNSVTENYMPKIEYCLYAFLPILLQYRSRYLIKRTVPRHSGGLRTERSLI